MPQESRTLLEDIKSIYKAIAEEVKMATENDEKLLIMGDLNCKVGLEIKNNKEEVSKGGRELLKLVNQHSLKLINSQKCCTGLWTRIQDEEHSILDYILVRKEDVKLVKSMEIDEGKYITPYSLDNSTRERVFTDHFMITCEINWKLEEKQKTQTKKLDKTKVEAYKQELEEEKVSELIDERPIRESYSEWNEKTLHIRDKYCTRKKVRRKWKVHRVLSKEMKRIKQQLKGRNDKDTIKELKMKKATIMDLIDEELIQKQYTRVSKIISDVKEAGGVNSATFWDVRNKFVGRRCEAADVMEDENGVIQEDPEEIKEIHARYFENLLKRRESSTVEGKAAEETIKLVERGMEIIARKQRPQCTERDEVENIVNKLNVKKARDAGTWSNYDIKEGGNEMIESLHKIFLKMDKELDIANEWEAMEIKPVHKKDSRRQMKNKRGLFLTNNISKIFEKVIKERNSDPFYENITEWQTGGVKRRAGVDNVMVVAAVIERDKYYGKNTYITFTDAEKCFDKLWLEDGINELWRLGMNIRDSIMIKRMNEVARIVVQTPLGPTREIQVERIVKQGTVYGPQICISSMDKINLLGNDIVTQYGPNLLIRAVAYVDDVTGAGGVANANNVIKNCNILEDQKKMTFSNQDGKTEYLVVVNDRATVRTVTAEVKNGPVKRVSEHKLLGTWFDETGQYGINIRKRKIKFQFMIKTAKQMGSPKNMGTLAVQARLKIAEAVIMPSTLYNAEAFAEYTVKEAEELEKLQASMLRQLLEVPMSSPNNGILMETGWPTVEAQLDYRKLMLYHNILWSDEKRTIKKILEVQKEENRRGTWHYSICRIIEKYEITLQPEQTLKSTWKHEVKEVIRDETERKIREKSKEQTKTRTVRNGEYQLKDYLEAMPLKISKEILRYRLHMVKIPMNYKNIWKQMTCPLCSEEEGTTEHYFTCKEVEAVRKVWEVSNLDEEDPKKMENIARFFQDVQTMIEPKWEMQRKSTTGRHHQEDVKPSMISVSPTPEEPLEVEITEEEKGHPNGSNLEE